jgi:hypothetical protein
MNRQELESGFLLVMITLLGIGSCFLEPELRVAVQSLMLATMMGLLVLRWYIRQR